MNTAENHGQEPEVITTWNYPQILAWEKQVIDRASLYWTSLDVKSIVWDILDTLDYPEYPNMNLDESEINEEIRATTYGKKSLDISKFN